MRSSDRYRTRRLVAVLVLVATLASCTLMPVRRADPAPAQPAPARPAPADPAQPPAERREPVPQQPVPQIPEWRTLGEGQQSAARVPVARSIVDAGVWAEVWSVVHANQADPPPVPHVDFSQETVLLVILGERPTAGYSVAIAAVVQTGREVEARIAVGRPSPDAMVAQVLTAPWTAVAVPVTGKPVVFTGDSIEAGFEGD